jgi:hypothetical protein
MNNDVRNLSICEKINLQRLCVGFEVLTAMVMKSSIFRDITLCSLSTNYTALYISEDRTTYTEN